MIDILFEGSQEMPTRPSNKGREVFNFVARKQQLFQITIIILLTDY
jgi:hypothetical protein